MATCGEPMLHGGAHALALLENKDTIGTHWQETLPVVDKSHQEKLDPHEQSNACQFHDEDHGADSTANGRFPPPPNRTRPWKLMWIRWGPLCGLFCMLAALSSVAASLAILVASNNSPTNSWQFEPSAYMALFTAIANQALRVAIVHGVAISWWTKSLRGTTLKELHYDYQWLNGIPSWTSLRAGYRVTMVGIACIASSIVAMDGPLLQKASIVLSMPIENEPVSLNISISPQIPHGVSGMWFRMPNGDKMFGPHIPTSDGMVANDVMTGLQPLLFQTESAYVTDRGISGFVAGCSTTCSVKVRAPAVAVTVSKSRVIDVDYYKYNNSAQLDPFVPGSSAFVAAVTLLLDHSHEKINLLTGYATARNCIGTFNYTAMTLESAIGEYDVRIVNGSVDPLTIGRPKIVALSNNTYSNGSQSSSQHSTLAGIVNLLLERWRSSIQFGVIDGEATWSIIGNTGIQAAFIATGSEPTCPSYHDPAPAIFQNINALMFRVGVLVAQTLSPTQLAQALDPGLEVNTTAIGGIVGTHNVFKPDLRWFMAAALVEIVCISLIFPTYLGWWKIGRPISFSPLEIAKAFEAPLLSDCDSNATGNEIAKAVGDVRVKYGVVDAAPDALDRNPKTELAFASPEKVGQMGSYSQSKV